jgi:excisionase family DNA binding protein
MTKLSAPPPRMLTVVEVADRLQVCTKTVRRSIEAGDLHAHRIGRLRRIAEDDLLLFIAKRRE